MKRFSMFAVCLFILILSTAALAQTPQVQDGKRKANRNHGQPKKMKKMDANSDGQITRDEWKGRDRRFQKADLNNDGVISVDEIKARRRKA